MGRPRGEDTIRYNFRMSKAAKEKMDKVAPPTARARSPFIREALQDFLSLENAPTIINRSHMTNREKSYKQVCATLQPEIVGAITKAYPENSISVVIQAAVMWSLEKK